MLVETIRPYNITIAGGGTGAAVLARAARLVNSPDGRPVHVTVINVATDDGGSTRLKRAEPLNGKKIPGRRFYIGAMGDARQSIAALADDPQKGAELNQRDTHGHPKGNILIHQATAAAGGDFAKGIAAVAKQYGAKGQVIPATDHPEAQIELVHYNKATGQLERIHGEHAIDTYPVTDPDAYIEVTPKARLTRSAHAAIANADVLILAMGSRYASQEAMAAIPGYNRAVVAQGKRGGLFATYANAAIEDHVPFPAHHVADEVVSLQRYTERPFDYVFYNNDVSLLPQDRRKRALSFDAQGFKAITATVIGAPLITRALAAATANDPLQRQPMRHDIQQVAHQLEFLLADYAAMAFPASSNKLAYA